MALIIIYILDSMQSYRKDIIWDREDIIYDREDMIWDREDIIQDREDIIWKQWSTLE